MTRELEPAGFDVTIRDVFDRVGVEIAMVDESELTDLIAAAEARLTDPEEHDLVRVGAGLRWMALRERQLGGLEAMREFLRREADIFTRYGGAADSS